MIQPEGSAEPAAANHLHARVFDLPGWSCPGTVRKLADTAGAYGFVGSFAVGIDADGYLWVDGNATPVPRGRPIYIEWTPDGLAAHIPPGSYGSLGPPLVHVGRPAAKHVPIARLLPELPAARRRNNDY